MTQKLLLPSLAVSDTCKKVEKDCVSVFFFFTVKQNVGF